MTSPETLTETEEGPETPVPSSVEGDRHTDIDALLAKYRQDPPRTFRLLGRTWQLKHSRPTAVMLQYLRMAERENGLMTLDEQGQVLDAMFTKGTWDSLIAEGVSNDEIEVLMVAAMAAYSGGNPTEAAERHIRKQMGIPDEDADAAGGESGEPVAP